MTGERRWDKLADLSAIQRAKLDRLRLAVVNKRSATLAVVNEIRACKAEGVSYRMMQDYTGVNYVQLFKWDRGTGDLAEQGQQVDGQVDGQG